MAPKKHLTVADVKRTPADAAGLIPLIAGAFGNVDTTKGLYIDKPLFKHKEISVDQSSGKWPSFTAEILGRLAVAMESSQIHITDTLLSKTGAKTPLADIFKYLKKVEKKMVDRISKSKATMAENNAIIRLKIIQELRSVVNSAIGIGREANVKAVIQKILKKAYDENIKKLKDVQLNHDGGELNEAFSGLEEIEKFYETYIKGNRDLPPENKKADGSLKAQDLKAEGPPPPPPETEPGYLKPMYEAQELRSIHSFTEYVDAIHVHYDTFLESNKLNTAGNSVKDEWRRLAHPVPESSSVSNTEQENTGNAIVGSFIWAKLIERCEIFSSIARTFFTGVIGTGFKGIKEIIHDFVELSILSSTASLFVVKSTVYSVTDIQKASFASDKKVDLIAKQVSSLQSGFDSWLTMNLDTLSIHSVKELMGSADDGHFSDITHLMENIRVGIHGAATSAHWFTLTENSSVRGLYIQSTAKAIKDSISSQYKLQNDSLLNWAKTTDPKAKQPRTKALTHYVSYEQHNTLRKHILTNMIKTTTLDGLTEENLQKTFAAKLIATIHYKDALFDALYLLGPGTGGKASRSELAKSTLKTIGSVLTQYKDSLGETHLLRHSPLKSLRDYTKAATAAEKESTTYNPGKFLYDASDIWSSKFTLVDKISIKVKNNTDRSLTPKTDTHRPSSATPQRPQSAKDKKKKEQPDKTEKKRPQSANKTAPGKKQSNKGQTARQTKGSATGKVRG